jgi:hypothetical protein
MLRRPASARRSLGHKSDPVVEWLIVSDGRPDASLRYLVGVDPVYRLDQLADICRPCFPDSYEFERIDFHPRQVEAYTRGSDAQGDVAPTEAHETDPDPETATHRVSDGGSESTATPSGVAVRPTVAGVEYVATTDLGRDWQTSLTPFATVRNDTDSTRTGGGESGPRGPLATLVETMLDVDVPVVYQVLCRPHRDWSGDAEAFIQNLDDGLVSVGDKLWHTLTLPDRERIETYDPPEADQVRIESIADRDARRTVSVTARAVALGRADGDGPSATVERTADRLAGAFGSVGGRFHDVRGRVRTDAESGAMDGVVARISSRDGLAPGQQVYEQLLDRTAHAPSYASMRSRLPFATPTSRGIVVTPAELPSFCVLDGAGLTDRGRRAIGTRPTERTGLALPPPRQLARYRPPGMPLVRPLDSDRQSRDDPVVLPPALQLLHVLLVGATGAGKSTTLTESILDNVEATDGPDILVDSKGGGMARDYCRAHYARHGDLDDILGDREVQRLRPDRRLRERVVEVDARAVVVRPVVPNVAVDLLAERHRRERDRKVGMLLDDRLVQITLDGDVLLSQRPGVVGGTRLPEERSSLLDLQVLDTLPRLQPWDSSGGDGGYAVPTKASFPVRVLRFVRFSLGRALSGERGNSDQVWSSHVRRTGRAIDPTSNGSLVCASRNVRDAPRSAWPS